MAKTIHINESINIITDRRPNIDGYWEDTNAMQIAIPLLKAMDKSGECFSLTQRNRGVLYAISDDMAHEVKQCVESLRSYQDLFSGTDFSEIKQTLEVAENLLQQPGLDGTLTGADNEAQMLVPLGMLPLLEMCYLRLSTWHNEIEEEEEPLFVHVYAGGKILMGEMEVEHE